MKGHTITAKLKWIISFGFIYFVTGACSKETKNNNPPVPPPVTDSSLVNEQHLDHLYTPVIFPDGEHAAGVYIYSQYPDYTLVDASGEGFTCVDDVSRAALFFARCPDLMKDTAKQSKLVNLVKFVLEMQSPSGYFYNFLQLGSSINTTGPTSAAVPEWWSWRAFQCLTEVVPVMQNINASLANAMDQGIQKLLTVIKSDLIPLPETTEVYNGITIPTWLPSGSATDQTAPLLLGMVNYVSQHPDTALQTFTRKLADGLMLMEIGDSLNFPFSMILSFQNTWHAYGADQPYALLEAGSFLHDTAYVNAGLRMVRNFYPWILKNNVKSSLVVNEVNDVITQFSGSDYDQIAYGYRPMVFAAITAYQLTGDPQYADLAGKISAWFFGANDASSEIYNPSTGVCFDGISTGNSVNKNSGAESTIEALLTFEKVEANPVVKTYVEKYKNQ
jgi:hypothetical protein